MALRKHHHALIGTILSLLTLHSAYPTMMISYAEKSPYFAYVAPILKLLPPIPGFPIIEPTSTTGTSSGSCAYNSYISSHVYHPNRLVIQKTCAIITGRVDKVTPEADGDYHVR